MSETCNYCGEALREVRYQVGQSGACCSLGCAESSHCNIYRPRPELAQQSPTDATCCALCEANDEVRRLLSDLRQLNRENLIFQDGIRRYRKLIDPKSRWDFSAPEEIVDWENNHGKRVPQERAAAVDQKGHHHGD